MIKNGINPVHNTYYIGSLIIKHFNITGKFELGFNELYAEVKKLCNCSIKLFWLSLTWLYVLDIIDTNENGDIKYVS